MDAMTYDTKVNWATSCFPTFDLFTNMHNQVIYFIGSFGQAKRIVPDSTHTVTEHEASMRVAVVGPYRIGNYKTTKALSVVIDRVSRKDYVARFVEADIAVSDDTPAKAIRTLKEIIFELYDIYKFAPLGPEPSRQFAILENYVGQIRE